MEGDGDWKKGKLRVGLYTANGKTDRGQQQGWEKEGENVEKCDIKDKRSMRCYKAFLIG